MYGVGEGVVYGRGRYLEVEKMGGGRWVGMIGEGGDILKVVRKKGGWVGGGRIGGGLGKMGKREMGERMVWRMGGLGYEVREEDGLEDEGGRGVVYEVWG